jgi:hypothetical protein
MEAAAAQPPRGALLGAIAPSGSWGALSDAATDFARSQTGSPAPAENAAAGGAPDAPPAPLARAVTVQLPLMGAPRAAWLLRTKSEGALPCEWVAVDSLPVEPGLRL